MLRSPSSRTRAGFALMALLLGACGAPPSTQPPPAASDAAAAGDKVLDLATYLRVAERRREVERIAFGTAAARPHLIRGWGRDESDGRQTFVWALGEASEIDVFVSRPRDVTLVLEVEPLVYAGAPRQAVAITAGDAAVGEIELEPRRRRYRLTLPAGVLHTGRNRLRFAYRHHRAPAEVLPGSADRRPLAVRWYALELRGLGTGATAPSGSRSLPVVELPCRTSVVYYLEAADGQELRLEQLLARPAGGATLRVRLELEGRPPQVHDVDPATAPIPWVLPLPAAPGAILAVELAALDAGGWWRDLWRDDDDGLALIAPAVYRQTPPATASSAAAPAVETPPNVVLYLIDTVRADHLGTYGYPRPTSPEIDRFAAGGVVFTHAEAQSSWTRTAVLSILTGLNAQSHRVNQRDDALPAAFTTLAEHLQQAGYATLAMVTNGNVSQTFGLDQGFDRFVYLQESRQRLSMHQLSDRLNDELFPLLERLARGEKPFFLYLHATDPHAPYTPPEPFRSRFAAGVDPSLGYLERVHAISRGELAAPEGTREAFIDLYDGEIAFNDHHFGRLLDRLRALGLYDDALIVLISDHGEEFLDHGGWEHGKTLNAEQLRVPLIVKLPGGAAAGRRVSTVARQIDVLPTVLELAGIAPPAGLDGRSLLPAIRGDGAGEVPSFSYLGLDRKRIEAVVARGFKAILDDSPQTRAGRAQLYDVVRDAGERHNLYGQRPLVFGFLRQTLLALPLSRRSALPDPERAAIDDELRRRLEAMGYVQ